MKIFAEKSHQGAAEFCDGIVAGDDLGERNRAVLPRGLGVSADIDADADHYRSALFSLDAGAAENAPKFTPRK